MNVNDFVAMDWKDRGKLLLKLADNSLCILKKYQLAYTVSKNALWQCELFFDNVIKDPNEIAKYMHAVDPDFDLSAQFDFINDDAAAISTLNIICYAYGDISRSAYLKAGSLHMPEPVELATPDITFEAIAEYNYLHKSGLVPDMTM